MPVLPRMSPYLSGKVGIGISYTATTLGDVLRVDYARLAPSLGPLKATDYTPMSEEQERLNRKARKRYERNPVGTPDEPPPMTGLALPQ